MPSSFLVKRNYAHCPLKKRPLSLYNEPAVPEQEEPEDLSIKRPRRLSPSPERKSITSGLPEQIVKEEVTNGPLRSHYVVSNQIYTPEPSSTTSHSNSSGNYVSQYHYSSFQNATHPANFKPHYFNSNLVDSTTSKRSIDNIQSQSFKPSTTSTTNTQENLPSLAEYYLQLFKSTSEAEAKKKEESVPPTPSWHSTYHFPPSPQNSPTESLRQGGAFPHQNAGHYYAPQMQSYPESSALISPISTCSSTTSESDDDVNKLPHQEGPRIAGVRYSCESCGKSYSTQSGLRKHNELHCSSLGPRAFTCKHCTKAYTTIGALKMHIRTHTLPCKCHVCGKAFSRPWLLQGHIRTHTGEKPFECQLCHRSFADRSNLRAHQQTHERVKKYACQTCKKTFSRMSLLNKHSEGSCVRIKVPSISPASSTLSVHTTSASYH